MSVHCCGSGSVLRHVSSHMLFPELLTIQTSPFPIMRAAVINWVGLYQRNYFSPQPELSLVNRFKVIHELSYECKTMETMFTTHTRAQFHMTTSALWDKQAHRWSGVTPAGRLPVCGVLPCCDSILSVPESALPPSFRETFLTRASHIARWSLSYCISHAPSSGSVVNM